MSTFYLQEMGFSNLRVLEEMYHLWLIDPRQVDASWARVFATFEQSKEPILSPKRISVSRGAVSIEKEYAVFRLIEAYRMFGHLKAMISPLHPPLIETPQELELARFGLRLEDLEKVWPTFGLLQEELAPLKDTLAKLEKVYCRSVGVEYMGLVPQEVEAWIVEKIESQGFCPPMSTLHKRWILEDLNRSELFETFLHKHYPGQKRFSLEGIETLIPVLSFLVERGASLKASEFYIGMAHRGRLNVLTNLMRKTFAQVFGEFSEQYVGDLDGGDVKYHKGYQTTVTTHSGSSVGLSIADNPSHLESVYPVVEGIVRARVEKRSKCWEEVVPVVIHGDAAIAGQGVVYETLQMSRLPAFETGGTIHLVLNNEIGFTTLPEEGRSTRYCTDLAKGFSAPIFHVNAEDPESAVFVAELAIELRQRFHIDVFIDLVGYRKYGHNEGDEPSFTQPLLYQQIKEKKTIREAYRDHLISEGHVEASMAQALEQTFRKSLIETTPSVTQEVKKETVPVVLEKIRPTSLSELQDIATKLQTLPENFAPHHKIVQLYKERANMVLEPGKPIDWATAETWAYATLLVEGSSIRLTGQDVARGTFSHRQSVVVDQKNGTYYIPLNHLQEGQGTFEVFNSHLSEMAVLAFEYGYSLVANKQLVIWEAQFGDFANGAQVIIDQYLVSSEQKWGKRSSLTLFLPHGYEGQGPEHSSARLERFLQLAGKGNIQVVVPTTPAQMFHCLRHQISTPKPLIIFTPKTLLRHPCCVSVLEDFIEGGFQKVLPDPLVVSSKVLVLCSGKVYYQAVEEREKRGITVPICRIERLYPFPEEEIKALVDGKEKLFWLQEEPENMGAWNYMGHALKKVLPKGASLTYVGRKRSATTAVGSFYIHKQEEKEIMDTLFKAIG